MSVVKIAKIKTKNQAGILGNQSCKKEAAATASAIILIVYME